MIPTAATQLSFWAKFMELQYKMIAHAADAPSGHMFASEPTEWPLLARSIAYWLSPHSNVSFSQKYAAFYENFDDYKLVAWQNWLMDAIQTTSYVYVLLNSRLILLLSS